MKYIITLIFSVAMFAISVNTQAQGTTLATATAMTAGSGSFAISNTGSAPAITFACNTTTGYTSPNCYVAWYSITVTNPATVTLDFESNGTNQDIFAVLFSADNCSTTNPTNLNDLDCEREGLGGVQVSANMSPNRSYYVMIGDFNCSASVAQVNYTMTETALAATNDEPCTASTLTVGGASVAGTIGDYTETCITSDPPNTCTNSSNTGYDGSNACRDAWYTVTVPSDGTLQLEMTSTAGSSDLTMAAYTSLTTCDNSNLIFLECDDDGGTAGLPLLSMTGLTPGATIYVRVWDFDCDSPTAEYTISASVAPILLDLSTTGTTVNLDCGTTYDFYDSGGPGIVDGSTDYQNDENYTITFCATAGNNVRLSFLNKFNSTVSTGTIYRPACDGTHAFDVDAGGNGTGTANDGDLADYMTFYDGNSSGSSVIGVYTGETMSYPSPGTVVSSGQCLTVNFKTSNIVVEEGWEAKIECIADVTPQALNITCPGGANLFTDDAFNAGMAADLQQNDQWIATYCPDAAGLCAFAGVLSGIKTLNLNQNVDYLYVYNGTDDTSSPIGIFTGSGDNDLTGTENVTDITGITAFPDYTPSNTGGCLTFKLVTNNTTNYPDWTTVSGFSLDTYCVECDLGNGGGTECSTATEITQNGFWAGTSVDDTGNGYEATYNPTGTDLDEYTSGVYTNNCKDPSGVISGSSQITRLENTIWYHFTTPDICEELTDLEIFLNYISCQNERDTDNGIQFVIWEGDPNVPLSCPADGTAWDNDGADGTLSAGVTTNDMIDCYDKLTSGTSITVSGLESFTDYYIMIDGFTGQHCFFDIYIGLFPAELAMPLIDGTTDPANFCSGSTEEAVLTAESNASVEFVAEPTAYTSIAAAQAAATGTAAYAAANSVLGTVAPTQNAAGDGEVTYTIAGDDFVANTTCGIQVYNVYAIAEDRPATPYGNGSDATADDCFPYVSYQIVIYPTPTITVSGDCELTFAATGCDITDFTLTVDGNVIAQGSEGNAIDFTATNNDGDMIAWSAYLDGMPTALQATCATSGTETLSNCATVADIGNQLFLDMDNDGIYDANEYPLPNVGVVLYDATTNMPVPGFSSTTDLTGNYLFEDVPPGDYYIVFTPPAGSGLIPSTAGTGDNQNNIDSTAGNGATATADFNFPATADDLAQDAGFIGTGSIGDFVWFDDNGDGIQDGGAEFGINGVGLELTYAGSDGIIGNADDYTYPIMMTSGGGNYDFNGLPPGVYEVAVVSGEPANITTANNPTGNIILGGGQDYDNADFGYDDPALPVELLSFTGILIDDYVQLDWTTVTEINSDYFSIERSTDGVSFREIGTKDAAGESSSSLSYDHQDKDPFNGMNYYRLKMIDRDETFTYSNVVAIQLSDIRETVAYPSPTKGQLFVNAGGKINTIIIFDAAGKSLRTINGLGNENAEINVNQLSAGIYFLKVETDSRTDVIRFIKE